jgi:hypothetical protein
MTERAIYSPKEARTRAGCERGYMLSLERSQTLVPHRHDIPSTDPKTRPLVYYDITQVHVLIAAVKLRDFISPKYLHRLMKEDRFLEVSDRLIVTMNELEAVPIELSMQTESALTT